MTHFTEFYRYARDLNEQSKRVRIALMNMDGLDRADLIEMADLMQSVSWAMADAAKRLDPRPTESRPRKRPSRNWQTEWLAAERFTEFTDAEMAKGATIHEAARRYAESKSPTR